VLKLLDKTVSLARAVLPGPVFGMARRLATAFLAPVLFSHRTGHFRSSLLGRSVDRFGAPIPWYTYPAFYFLDAQNLAGRTVLEFGAGQSTLWWAAKGALVTAFDNDPEWVARLGKDVPDDARLYLVSGDAVALENLLPDQAFDIIIIDGLDRLQCARLAVGRLAPSGAVLLDNSDGYWGGDHNGTYPILELFRGCGFQRIDFFGAAPGVIRPHCTSLFWKGCCFLLEGAEAPPRNPLGL
jgi:hypothetical protein